MIRAVASAILVLQSPLKFGPLILLFQGDISYPLSFLVLVAYMALMFSFDFVIASLIPRWSDFAAGLFLGIGILGFGISFLGIMTWGWITIWPTVALLALAITSIAKSDTNHVPKMRRRRVAHSVEPAG